MVYKFLGKFSKLYSFFLNISGYQRSVDYFVQQIPFPRFRQIRVLDAGCGAGLYTLEVLRQFPNSEIIAFDLNVDMIRQLQNSITEKKLIHRVHALSADITSDLINVHGVFDLIITAGIFEHVPLQQTLINLSRFLKFDGLILNSPVKNNLYGIFIGKLFGFIPYATENIVQEFTKLGYKLIKTISLPWYQPSSFKYMQLYQKITYDIS